MGARQGVVHRDMRDGDAVALAHGGGDGARRHAVAGKRADRLKRRLLRRVPFQARGAAGADFAEAGGRNAADVAAVPALRGLLLALALRENAALIAGEHGHDLDHQLAGAALCIGAGALAVVVDDQLDAGGLPISDNGQGVNQVPAQPVQRRDNDHVTALKGGQSRPGRPAKDRRGAAHARVLVQLKSFQACRQGEAGNLPALRGKAGAVCLFLGGHPRMPDHRLCLPSPL